MRNSCIVTWGVVVIFSVYEVGEMRFNRKRTTMLSKSDFVCLLIAGVFEGSTNINGVYSFSKVRVCKFFNNVKIFGNISTIHSDRQNNLILLLSFAHKQI